jgi:hypothetical protein
MPGFFEWQIDRAVNDGTVRNPELKRAILAESLQRGKIASLTYGSLTGAAVLCANHYSSGFRRSHSVSGKLAYVVMGFFGSFFLQAERSLHSIMRDPAAHGINL